MTQKELEEGLQDLENTVSRLFQKLNIKEKFLKFEVDEPENINPQIIKFLVSENLNIISLEEIKPSLEQAYLKFVE